MLKTRPIRHFTNDLDKRWMKDDYFDLVVWYNTTGSVYGFQLGYGEPEEDHVLTWTQESGTHHARVSYGTGTRSGNVSPVLVHGPWIEFPFEEVYREFVKRTVELDPEIRQLVEGHLVEYARRQKPAASVEGGE